MTEWSLMTCDLMFLEEPLGPNPDRPAAHGRIIRTLQTAMRPFQASPSGDPCGAGRCRQQSDGEISAQERTPTWESLRRESHQNEERQICSSWLIKRIRRKSTVIENERDTKKMR